MSDHQEKPQGPAARARRPRSSKILALNAALAPMAEAINASLDDERVAPRILLSETISCMARQLGQILRNESIFRSPTRSIFTVDEDGLREPMTAVRFTSWVEEFVVFGRIGRDEDFRACSLPTDTAAKVLAADVFREQLRVLRATYTVRMPGWIDGSRTSVRLLPPGYDEPSECMIVDGLPFREDQPIEEALEWLEKAHGGFPWADEAAGGIRANRSYVAHLVACLSHFCAMLRGSSLRPAIVFLANQPGSGKSLLAYLGIAASHGTPSATTWSRDEGEQAKILTTLAAEGWTYALLDNLRGHLQSGELESFLTSPVRTGRVLGKSETVTAPNQAQVVLTGNGLTLSPDLARRSLIIDLFCSRDATEREFEELLTEEKVRSADFRSKLLAALWAMVREWGELNCPMTEKRHPPGRIVPSFEDFSRTFGGITGACGLGDPFATPAVVMDETGAAWKEMLRSLAGEVPTDATREFDTAEVLAKITELGLEGVLIGDAQSPQKTLGRRLKPWLGRELEDHEGRTFRFGAHRQAAGRGYRISFVKAG